jgi:ribosome-binding protein aMBF1 (putative translation factor)
MRGFVRRTVGAKRHKAKDFSPSKLSCRICESHSVVFFQEDDGRVPALEVIKVMAHRTSDALEFLQRKIGSDPAFSKIVEQEREKSAVARAIYNLRMQVGLSQTELAKRVGTKQSVIARLEDGDYTSHLLSILSSHSNTRL